MAARGSRPRRRHNDDIGIIAVGGEGAELEDGLGSFESPSRACYVHSVLYDVAAGSLDDPGGDGPAFGQCRGVVQVAVLVFQVAGAFVGAGALGGRVAVGGGAAADPGGDLAGLAVQDLAGLVSDPFLGGGLALVKERPGGLPAVFQLSTGPDSLESTSSTSLIFTLCHRC
jgi:hypothetical protein